MEPVPVFRANSAAQARLVQDWLEDNGISSTLVGTEADTSGLFDIVDADPIVIVAAEDFERATAALQDFATSVKSAQNLEQMEEEEGLFGWPLCPTCDELRPANCRNCGYSGSEYEVQSSEGGSSIRCLKCKELTTVDQVDTCPFCRHSFNDRDMQSADSTNEVPASVNRTLILIVGIVLVIAIVAATILLGGS